jgi:putative NADH-flavin reductase
MKITVFGATGGTGLHLVRQAIEAGHDVTAVVRDPARLTEVHPRLTVITGDVMDPESIGSAVAGRDAVASAIGPRGGGAGDVCATSAASIVKAMDAQGVRRFVAVSNSGMIRDAADGPLTRFVVKPILRRLLREPWADAARMETVIRASDLDWTLVRPPMLTDGPHTGRYRSAVEHTVRGGIRISRADVADAVLRALVAPSSARTAVAVGN